MSAFVILCAALWLAALAVIAYTAACENVDRHVERALSDPLPAVDATDAEFEQWAMRALGIANSAAFETTAREIRALPETRKS